MVSKFEKTSFNVRVEEYQGKNLVLNIRETNKAIDPEKSYVKKKKGWLKVVIYIFINISHNAHQTHQQPLCTRS